MILRVCDGANQNHVTLNIIITTECNSLCLWKCSKCIQHCLHLRPCPRPAPTPLRSCHSPVMASRIMRGVVLAATSSTRRPPSVMALRLVTALLQNWTISVTPLSCWCEVNGSPRCWFSLIFPTYSILTIYSIISLYSHSSLWIQRGLVFKLAVKIM